MNQTSKFLAVVAILAGLGIYGQTEKSPQSSGPEWRVVYQNDAKGNALYGDVEQLISAVRAGLPIRVAWASKRPNQPISVEHVVDANFLTVMSGAIVQAQIHRIYGQNPDFAKKIMKFREGPLNYWSAIFSTNGKATMLGYDIENDKFLGQNERTMGIIWYALLPPQGLPKTKPLWLPRR